MASPKFYPQNLWCNRCKDITVHRKAYSTWHKCQKCGTRRMAHAHMTENYMNDFRGNTEKAMRKKYLKMEATCRAE